MLFVLALFCCLACQYGISTLKPNNSFSAYLNVLLLKYCQMLIISSAGVSFGNVITPVESHVSGTEGDIISLSCSYSSARSLFWYHQYPGSAPEFLFLILHATGEVLQKSKTVDQDPRFSAKLNEKKTHVDLEISSAKVSDSAMYYCALEPTVTGKQTTLDL
uniref:T-cell receptor alpha/delta variable 25.0.3 n=1 Tax=Cyprinus carpio TaxID=7962 RepID=A0A8C1JU55_CYPCA